MPLRLRLSAVLIALACSACGNLVTDGDVLTPLQQSSCTQRSESANWPVKVLFVVEDSGSMCVVDPPGTVTNSSFCEQVMTPPGIVTSGRVKALSSFFQSNASRPNLSTSILTFGTLSQATRFQSVADGPPLELPTLQSTLSNASDLQGGLELAATRLSEDMEATTPELRARTKYIVVVLSKGVPFPRCSANDGLSSYASPSDPSGTWADSPGAETFCNSGSSTPEDNIPGFVAGGDRNQNAQLLAAVDSIVSLKGKFGVGDVRVHTALLFDSATVASCGAICQDAMLGTAGHDVGHYTLEQLALHGQGTFVDPGSPQQLTLGGMDTSEFTTFCP